MGESEVGKSCLIKRYCEERFIQRYVSTIGVDFGVKKVVINGKEIRANFWDLSGHPEFFEVRNEFYKDSQGAILVYDVNQRKSFEALDVWLEEALKYGAKNLCVAVCGNKSDENKRAVAALEGQQWADKRGFLFFETSALTGENVSQMFEQLFAQITKSMTPS